MRARLTFMVAVASALVLTTGVVLAADKTVRTNGDNRFVANAMIQSTLRFTPGTIRVESGSEVTWQHDDRTTEPHTITIVEEADLPTSADEVFACEACGAALDGHFGGGGPVLDVGALGLDAPGDSLLFFDGESVTATVSAGPGTTLSYLCAIHPWMQGEINVQ